MVGGYDELEAMLPKNLRQRKALAVKRKLDWVTLAKKAKRKKKARSGGGRCDSTLAGALPMEAERVPD